jgi:hypothetical protein
MATKHKSGSKKKRQAKRVVTEIAPAVRIMLDAYITGYNEGPDRVSPLLKYTDVINQALDEFLPGKPQAGEVEDQDKSGNDRDGKEEGG